MVTFFSKTTLDARVRILINKSDKIGEEYVFSKCCFLMVILVDGVCTVANCVGKELAPHVKKHGSKLVPESLKKDRNGKSPLDGAMVVAASSVQGNRRPRNLTRKACLLRASFIYF